MIGRACARKHGDGVIGVFNGVSRLEKPPAISYGRDPMLEFRTLIAMASP
jgi:hypothetical protein